jgi:hypothetical protein
VIDTSDSSQFVQFALTPGRKKTTDVASQNRSVPPPNFPPLVKGGLGGVVSELPGTGLQMKLATAISGMAVSKPEDTDVLVSVAIKLAFPPL